MADNRPTYPPKPRPKLASHDDLDAVRQADEIERLKAELLASQRANAAPRTPQERGPVSLPPPSAPAALKVHVSDWKGLASFVGMLASLGLGGGAWLAKAEAPKVEAQGQTIAVTREDLGKVIDRVEVVERFKRKQELYNPAFADYFVQVMHDGKIAIVTRPDNSRPLKPIESHMAMGLPGRKSPPILVIDTAYPSLEWVTE